MGFSSSHAPMCICIPHRRNAYESKVLQTVFIARSLHLLRSTDRLPGQRSSAPPRQQPRSGCSPRAAAVPMQPPEPGPAAAPGGPPLLPPLPERCRLGRSARSPCLFGTVVSILRPAAGAPNVGPPARRTASLRAAPGVLPPARGRWCCPVPLFAPASPTWHYACALPCALPSASGPGGGGAMERELLRQVLSYHGPSLLALLRSEQHDNPDFRGLLPPPGTVFEPPRGAPRSPSAWWGIAGAVRGGGRAWRGAGPFSARSPLSGPRRTRSSTPRYSASSPKRRTYSLLSRGSPMVLLPTTLKKMKVRASSWHHAAPPEPYICERCPNTCWTAAARCCAPALAVCSVPTALRWGTFP